MTGKGLIMRLHSFWRSNASYRVRVALNLKGLTCDEVQVDLDAGEQNSAAFRAINPNAAVPALEVDGHVLTQSLAICDFLERRYPEPPLLPADPYDRAEALAIFLATSADAHPLIVPRVRAYLTKSFGADDAAIKAWAVHWLTATLASFETRLTRRPPAPFAFGDTPGLADIAISSHVVLSGIFGVDMAPYPAVGTLTDRLHKIEAFKSAHPSVIKAAQERGRGTQG